MKHAWVRKVKVIFPFTKQNQIKYTAEFKQEKSFRKWRESKVLAFVMLPFACQGNYGFKVNFWGFESRSWLWKAKGKQADVSVFHASPEGIPCQWNLWWKD